ncbi:hypothetical protein L6452_37982 [Arctium lappa]|uniref:Uncharacterized protein n=1 Tax=Arctium lappa TaxID=4217 RepID=A0ACB8Y4H2_ARCLA|nr:hypothetical protein L6452_37982 [Arctium lappa]
MVKDCFTTHDRNFATRPNTAITRHMVYDNAGFALAPYGPYWRELRKLVTSELFTNQHLEKHKNVRNSEINSFVNNLFLSTLKNGDRTSTIDMSKCVFLHSNYVKHMILVDSHVDGFGKHRFNANMGPFVTIEQPSRPTSGSGGARHPRRIGETGGRIRYKKPTGQNYEYIPFSSGRRMCPAITFTFQVIHLTLARLLQGFDLSTPMGKLVDMSEGLGISLPKVKPLEVIVTPRLSRKLYG